MSAPTVGWSNSRVGVCSWSLRPESAAHLVELARGVGVSGVQLALDPIRRGGWDLEETRRALEEGGLRIFSGMWMPEGEDYSTLESIRRTGGVRPDETWQANVLAAKANAKIARRLGLRLVTFHAGAVPEERTAKREFVDRVARIARLFGEQGVDVALETGQETWRSMVELLRELDAVAESHGGVGRVGVNFDPANMILYGNGDPIEAMRELSLHIVQAHVKDAVATKKAGTWGTEVIAGTGDVFWPGFFEVVDVLDRPIALMIEREAGKSRVEDARAARNLIARLWSQAHEVTGAGADSDQHASEEAGQRGTQDHRVRVGDERQSGTPASERPHAISIGIIGMGFMGRTHLAAYQSLAKRREGAKEGETARVVAVCDPRQDARAGKDMREGNIKGGGHEADLRGVRQYATAKELLADPGIDAVSICTPTPTHKKLVWEALVAGKHVLVEKPAAQTAADARELADAARGADRLVMPAMCMRFWPGWDVLEELVHARPYGELTSLVLQRLGTTPEWSPSFYGDAKKTGGAIGDLHVHDADLVLWLLGCPAAVASTGTESHVATTYYFGGKRKGLVVTAEGSWDHTRGWPFTMRYVATFDEATVCFDSTREPRLTISEGGETRAAEVHAGTGYEHEVEHFVEAVASWMRGERVPTRVTMENAERVAALLECERASQGAQRIAEFEDPLLRKSVVVGGRKKAKAKTAVSRVKPRATAGTRAAAALSTKTPVGRSKQRPTGGTQAKTNTKTPRARARPRAGGGTPRTKSGK